MVKSMKKNWIICTLSVICTCFLSCNSSYEENIPSQPENSETIQGINSIVPPTNEFAKNDGASKLSDNYAEKVSTLLTSVGPKIVKDLAKINITNQQYEEIKEFTDKLVKNEITDKNKYNIIFNWITKNISYEYGNNDPYSVFKNKKAICQGYANLLTVMLYSQNIPAFNANGILDPIGGHAWNYVYLDDWYVSDPTNNIDYKMSYLYSYKHLIPLSLDVHLFENNNFIFNYQEGHLNILEVKKSEKQLIVPFSIGNFQISSFNPNVKLPTNIEEIYIGENIQTLGENIIGLNIHAPSIKYAYVDPKNTKLESYGQIVYKNSFPCYIPASATIIQFKEIPIFGKNFMKDHEKIETIIIQKGTKELESYAFENCPNLKKAYIPKETKIAENAFYKVSNDFQIIKI